MLSALIKILTIIALNQISQIKGQLIKLNSYNNNTLYVVAIKDYKYIFFYNNLTYQTQYIINQTVAQTYLSITNVARQDKVLFKNDANPSILIYQKNGNFNSTFSYHFKINAPFSFTTLKKIFSITYNSTNHDIIILFQQNILRYLVQSSGSYSTYNTTTLNLYNTTFKTISSFGNYIYLTALDGKLYVLDQTLTVKQIITIVNDISTNVTNNIVNSNGNQLFLSFSDGKIIQINIVNGIELTINRTYIYHTVSIFQMKLISNDQFLLTNDINGIVTQLRILDWKILSKLIINQKISIYQISNKKILGSSYNSSNYIIRYNNLQSNQFTCRLSNCIQCTNNSICIQCQQNYTLSVNKNSCHQPGLSINTSQPVSNYSLPQQISYQISLQEYFLELITTQQFVESFKAVYKAPLIRKAFKAGSLLFINLDQLWLYQYHNRTYGKNMKQIFQMIRQVQTQKWNLFQFQFLQNFKNILRQKSQDNKNYSHYNFVQIEGNDDGFFSNIVEFFVQNIPITFIAFLLVKLCFYLTMNYRISKLIRPFSFIGYYFLMISAGNILYLIYLSFNQTQIMFSLSVENKFTLAIWGVIFFGIVLFSNGSSFAFLYAYKKLSKYFLDNQYRLLPSFMYLSIEFGIRNTLLGFVHSYLFYNPKSQIYCLILIETMFLLTSIFFWSILKIFISQTLASIKIINSFLIICLDFLLIIQNLTFNNNQQEIWNLVQDLLLFNVLLFVGNSLFFVFCIIISAFYSLRHSIFYCIQKITKTNQQSQILLLHRKSTQQTSKKRQINCIFSTQVSQQINNEYNYENQTKISILLNSRENKQKKLTSFLNLSNNNIFLDNCLLNLPQNQNNPYNSVVQFTDIDLLQQRNELFNNQIFQKSKSEKKSSKVTNNKIIKDKIEEPNHLIITQKICDNNLVDKNQCKLYQLQFKIEQKSIKIIDQQDKKQKCVKYIDQKTRNKRKIKK